MNKLTQRAIPITSLTNTQRHNLARRVLYVLAALWLDQNGLEGEIEIVEKETPDCGPVRLHD